jgi:putative oxygen-independent coproporphyrinogen III oxidase
MNAAKTANAGLYIHIPFCVKKCDYCDFYSTTDLSLKNAFVDALIQEMELIDASLLTFDTLYFGGGTPSVLPAGDIERLLSRSFDLFDIQNHAEITIEVNPGTVGRNSLLDYRQVGINRINIGVQSFSIAALQFLGRIHTTADAEAAIINSRKAGFDNLGLDLIFGLPGQSIEDWQRDLEKAVGFSPEHLSCYTLTYEKGTPLESRKATGLVHPLDDDTIADLFEITQTFLGENNYEQYEIANYARLDRGGLLGHTEKSLRSRHNQKYWTSVPYIGLGPSAHSFVEPERRWNVADIQSYVSRLQQSVLPIEEIEILTDDERLTESLYLGLRTVEGINIRRLDKTFDLDFHARYTHALDDLVMQGMLELTETRCALTRKGMRFLDGVVGMFLGADVG